MKKDAELHADEDNKKKELVDTKNTADLTIFTTEKALTEHAAHVTEDIKTAVEEKIKSLRTAKDGTDKAAIETAIHELSTEMQKIGEAVSKAGAQSENSPAGGPEGEVKEAQAEEKAEEKPE
jgi:molecular chaperone DnaK (HSP70)